MLSTRFVRHIDDRGCITLPIANLQSINLHKGTPVEIFFQKDGTIVIRPYKKSWEETVLDWYNNHISLMESNTISFIHSGDYTICTYWDEQHHQCWVGKAKRYVSDDYNSRIGKVASYSHAVGIPLNIMIGWKD